MFNSLIFSLSKDDIKSIIFSYLWDIKYFNNFSTLKSQFLSNFPLNINQGNANHLITNSSNTYVEIELDSYSSENISGGGSGNAATAMYAFNHLLNYPASNNDMVEWSGEIGSDISFFFSTGTGKYSIV